MTLGNPRLHVARKSAVDAYEVRSRRVRGERAVDHPRGAECGRTDTQQDCGGTQRARYPLGARWAVVRAIGRERAGAGLAGARADVRSSPNSGARVDNDTSLDGHPI